VVDRLEIAESFEVIIQKFPEVQTGHDRLAAGRILDEIILLGPALQEELEPSDVAFELGVGIDPVALRCGVGPAVVQAEIEDGRAVDIARRPAIGQQHAFVLPVH